MGGNGARSAYMSQTLDNYTGVRFNKVDTIDGVKVIQVSNRSNTAQPMESFTSKMYYVANPKTGVIEHITFHDKKGNITHSIDLKYNEDGTLMPYGQVVRKGKVHTVGTHFHKSWPQDENGDKGRVSHNKDNVSPVNRYYMRFVNKAIKYNAKKTKK